MELRSGYKLTEMGVIPEDWECEKLSKFLSFISYGFTNPMPTTLDGVYMITAANINHGRLQLETARKTSQFAYTTLLSAKSKPQKNDILLTKDGTLGRLALVGDKATICINQSVAVIRPNTGVDPQFLKLLLESPHYQKQMIEDAGGSTIKHIYITIVDKMPIGLPSNKMEQQAIAQALEDVDNLIDSLDRLIAKKRDIKQAAMQQLLTGKKRLPGFRTEWYNQRLGAVCKITTGKKDVNEGDLNGIFPFFTCSRSYTFSNSYSFDTEAILVAGNGDVGNIHYFRGKFEAYQRTYVLLDFSINVNYLWHQLSAYLAASLGIGKIGSSIPYIKMENLLDFYFTAPIDLSEQCAIAQILSDMDAELAAFEQRRDKTKLLKQAMMQELLTGRIRLV